MDKMPSMPFMIRADRIVAARADPLDIGCNSNHNRRIDNNIRLENGSNATFLSGIGIRRTYMET